MEDLTKKLNRIFDKLVSTYKIDQLKETFSLVLKLLKNIVANPTEEKYRNFKISNEAIKTKILVIVESIEIMESIGYTQVNEELYSYTSESIANVKIAVQCIEKLLSDLEEFILKNTKTIK